MKTLTGDDRGFQTPRRTVTFAGMKSEGTFGPYSPSQKENRSMRGRQSRLYYFIHLTETKIESMSTLNDAWKMAELSRNPATDNSEREENETVGIIRRCP